MALVAFHLPSEDIRVARDIAAAVQVVVDIEVFAGVVVAATGVVVVVVDSAVEFAVQDMLQAGFPAPWLASVVPVLEDLLQLAEAAEAWLLADQMPSGASEAFRVDWAIAVDVRWVGHSFASVVYLLPQAEDHFAMAVESEVLVEMLPAWVLRPMEDDQPFVD